MIDEFVRVRGTPDVFGKLLTGKNWGLSVGEVHDVAIWIGFDNMRESEELPVVVQSAGISPGIAFDIRNLLVVAGIGAEHPTDYIVRQLQIMGSAVVADQHLFAQRPDRVLHHAVGEHHAVGVLVLVGGAAGAIGAPAAQVIGTGIPGGVDGNQIDYAVAVDVAHGHCLRILVVPQRPLERAQRSKLRFHAGVFLKPRSSISKGFRRIPLHGVKQVDQPVMAEVKKLEPGWRTIGQVYRGQSCALQR